MRGPALPADLTVGSLRRSYAAGRLDPVEVVDALEQRILDRGEDHVWISRVPHAELRAAAAALDPADLGRLPLWGVPYALKDNIDVAGLVTTAACPEFAYLAPSSAAVVERLRAAGALLVGKTNLDQFATGLNGTRSPYGAPASVDDPRLISGGSSSGSAVAVAAGLVSFAIGTDTAGSGRVPAALNGVIGVKPSIGLVSTTGIVPACRSLDCASVFSLDVADGAAVLAVLAGFDAGDPWSRPWPRPPAVPVGRDLAGCRLGVPAEVARWGDRGEREVWEKLMSGLEEVGAELVPLPMQLLLEAGRQLYDGAWLAERLDGLEAFLAEHDDAVLPEIRSVLRAADLIRGVDTFTALHDMQHRRRSVHTMLHGVDALLTPTVTETFTIEEMRADPLALNARLGTFTTFTNLLDLCAVAVPVGRGVGGAPVGVTVQAAAGRDAEVLALADALEALVTGRPVAATAPVDDGTGLELAVVGAHLEGMPLHGDLVARGARLLERTTTAPAYRLYELGGGGPARPGLRRVSRGGTAIEVEVYRLPLEQVGSFLATVTSPLAIGQVRLADQRLVHGFVCEPLGLEDAREITEHGGWRAFVSARSGAAV